MRDEFWFFHTERVRYVEVDAQRIVFNGHYLTYVDIGTTEYLRALPFDYAAAVRGGWDFHQVRVELDFVSPLHFDDAFDIGMRIARLGRTSFTWAFAIFRGDTVCAKGSMVSVSMGTQPGGAHGPVPIPEALRARVESREG